MKRLPSGPLDPRAHTMKMREAKRIAIELGASYRLTTKAELIFESKFLSPILVKANRREASDALVTWLRKLASFREQLRGALGVEAAT